MNFEKLLFKKIELWIILLLLILFVFILSLFGGILKHHYAGGERFKFIQYPAVFLAELPSNIRDIFDPTKLNESISINEIKRESSDINNIPEKHNLYFEVNDFLKGFILTSVYDHNKGSTKTLLIDLKLGSVIKEWYFDKKILNKYSKFKINPGIFRSQHPYLLNDGSLIFTEGEGPLVSIDSCSNLKWVLDRHTHHAINFVSDNEIIINTVLENYEFDLNEYSKFDQKKLKIYNIRDDGFAIFDHKVQKIIKEFSLTKIFLDNELIHHAYNYLTFRELEISPISRDEWKNSQSIDVYHLNDAEFIQKDDGFLNKGDIILSLRELHMVLIYRPNENKVIDYKIGPWTQQHDVDYAEGKITIFGNDSLYKERSKENSSIYEWDLESNKVKKILELKNPRVAIGSGGLHSIIEKQFIMIDHNNGLLIQDLKSRKLLLKLEFLTDDYKFKSAIHWSRYYNNISDFNLNKQC